MADFLRQIAFLFLDIFIGVLKSVSSDMKHSITARVKEQVVKRESNGAALDVQMSDLDCRQYQIMYLNHEILILKKKDDNIISCEVEDKDKKEPQAKE